MVVMVMTYEQIIYPREYTGSTGRRLSRLTNGILPEDRIEKEPLAVELHEKRTVSQPHKRIAAHLSGDYATYGQGDSISRCVSLHVADWPTNAI